MILVVTTNGILVTDTSLYHAPIILMLEGKVITQTVRKQVFDGVAEISCCVWVSEILPIVVWAY